MKFKQTLAALAVLAVLGAAAWSLYSDKTSDVNKEIAPVLDKQTADDYDRVVIKKGERVVTLEKGQDGWKLAGESAVAVDETAAKGALDKLASLRLADVVSGKLDDAARYDLDAQKAVEVIAAQAGREKRHFTLGKDAPGFRNSFVTLPGDARVFLSGEAVRSAFDREPKAWMNKQMIKFDKAEAVRLEITAPDGAFTLETRPAAAPEAPTPTETGKTAETGTAEAPPQPEAAAPAAEWAIAGESRPIDPAKINGLLSTLSSLRAADVALEADPAAAGLESPWTKVVVHLKDGSAKEIRIGNISGESTNRHARVEGEALVYLLPQYTTDKLSAPRQSYLKQESPGEGPRLPADPKLELTVPQAGP